MIIIHNKNKIVKYVAEKKSKSFKNLLTNSEEYGNIRVHLPKRKSALEKTLKKVKKLLKKVLTKVGQGGIIVKLSPRGRP